MIWLQNYPTWLDFVNEARWSFTAACYKMSNNPLTNLLFALVVYHGTIVCVGICSYTSNHLNSSEPKDVNLRNIIVITAWLFHVFLSHVGLPSHPQHELMKRQCTGCPGMITFYIKGKLKHASAFLSNLKVIWQYIFILLVYIYFICSGLCLGPTGQWRGKKTHQYNNTITWFFNALCCFFTWRTHYGVHMSFTMFDFSSSLVVLFQIFAIAESLGGYESLAEHP